MESTPNTRTRSSRASTTTTPRPPPARYTAWPNARNTRHAPCANNTKDYARPDSPHSPTDLQTVESNRGAVCGTFLSRIQLGILPSPQRQGLLDFTWIRVNAIITELIASSEPANHPNPSWNFAEELENCNLSTGNGNLLLLNGPTTQHPRLCMCYIKLFYKTIQKRLTSFQCFVPF